MAHTVQSVTLALTLPISCHICLGKVRKPVICVNHHVFCSVCIDLWLKNSNQCPVCRVAITPENPCKDIIGGASENEETLSYSVRKHLRKTRFELLHKEYEDEIESLIKKTEDLRSTNVKLEERLTEITDPVVMSVCNCEKQVENKNSFCDTLLEDWNKKLELMNTANKKVVEDIEKLKEENRRLKNENIECARENLRLKNEVELRSPQKFGRFTVAALEAKVEQYEREMSRLKKALERSDQYIEELEEQILQLKKPPEDKQIEKSRCGTSAVMEEHVCRPATSGICKKSNALESYPKNTHEARVSSEDSKDPTCHSSSILKHSKVVPKLENSLATASGTEKELSLIEDRPRNGIFTTSQDLGSPSSVSFCSLQLNTPDSKASSFSDANLKKPLTYLRKLTFDHLPKKQDLGISASSRNEESFNSVDGPMQNQEPNYVFQNVFHNIGKLATKNSKISENVYDGSLQFGNSTFCLQTICEEDFSQPETSSKNSLHSTFHDDDGIFHESMSHQPPNFFIGQPTLDNGIKGFRDNCTNSNGLPCTSVYPEREVGPQSISHALPERTSFIGMPRSYNNSSPAKRKLVNSSNSPSKSYKF